MALSSGGNVAEAFFPPFLFLLLVSEWIRWIYFFGKDFCFAICLRCQYIFGNFAANANPVNPLLPVKKSFFFSERSNILKKEQNPSLCFFFLLLRIRYIQLHIILKPFLLRKYSIRTIQSKIIVKSVFPINILSFFLFSKWQFAYGC